MWEEFAGRADGSPLYPSRAESFPVISLKRCARDGIASVEMRRAGPEMLNDAMTLPE